MLIGTKKLQELFAATVENVFVGQLGIAGPALLDYIVDMLVRFIRIEAIHKLRDIEGNRLDQVADMLTEAQQRTARPQAEAYCHIGDVTLFWCGFMIEALPRLKARSKKDYFVDYFEQGKRSYYHASLLDKDREPILRQLSCEFETCAQGLHLVKEELNQAA